METPRDTQSRFLTDKRWHDVGYWVVLVVACAIFLVMNLLTTFKEDDLSFALVEGVWTPIGSMADIVRSFVNQFHHATGRTSNLVPLLFSGLLGKMAFNICNTLVFGLLLHLVSLLATGRRSLLTVSAFLAFIGTCYPVPGETMLWMSGSANYMWAITLSLLLIYYLTRCVHGPLRWYKALMLAVLAFLAGSFNEATSFGVLAGMCLYYALNRHRIDRMAMVALACYLLGVLVIVASPAAWDRAQSGYIVVDMGISDLLSSRWHIFMDKMLRFYTPLLAIIVGLVALLRSAAGGVRNSMLAWVFVCLMLVMFVLGVTAERAYSPLATVAFIIVALAADVVLKRWHWLRLAVIMALLALGLFTFARGVRMLRDYKAFDDQVVSEIVSAPSQAVLPERQFLGYSRFIKPMNYQSNHFFAHELIYRAYYGKRNVQFVSDSVFARFNEGRLLEGATVLKMQSDHPEMVDTVYALPNQPYMAILLKGNALPCTFQTSRFYDASKRYHQPEEEDSKDELSRYGIHLDYVPVGFYPLEYQGRCYLIFDPVPESSFNKIVFPVDLPPEPVEVTILL